MSVEDWLLWLRLGGIAVGVGLILAVLLTRRVIDRCLAAILALLDWLDSRDE